jgi:hypothetical protein
MNQDLKGNVEKITQNEWKFPVKKGGVKPSTGVRILKLKREPLKTIYFFKEFNKLIKYVKYSGGGYVWTSQTSIYNEYGKVIETYYKVNNVIESSTKRNYNDYGQLISDTEYDKFNEIWRKTTYDYHDNNSTKISSDTVSMKDDQGELKIVRVTKYPFKTEKVTNKDVRRLMEEYEDDGLGNWIKKRVFDKEEYEYDEVGNWIKKRIFENDKEISRYERIIVYRIS